MPFQFHENGDVTVTVPERFKAGHIASCVDPVHVDLARQANALQVRIGALELENQVLKVQLALLAHGAAGQVG